MDKGYIHLLTQCHSVKTRRIIFPLSLSLSLTYTAGAPTDKPKLKSEDKKPHQGSLSSVASQATVNGREGQSGFGWSKERSCIVTEILHSKQIQSDVKDKQHTLFFPVIPLPSNIFTYTFADPEEVSQAMYLE